MNSKSWLALAIAFLITWAIALWIYSVQLQLRALYFPLVWLLTWIPGCVGIIMARLEGLKIPFFGKPERIHFIAFLIAWAIGIYVNYSPNPSDMGWFVKLMIFYPLMVLFIGGIHAFGESILWWGYLYKKLEHMQPVKKLLIIGISWGLWYAPLIILMLDSPYDSHQFKGLFLMPLFTTILSPLMLYFRRKGTCILTPAIFLATIELSTGLWSCRNGCPFDDLLDGITGLTGIKTLLFCSGIALFLLWKQGDFKKSVSS